MCSRGYVNVDTPVNQTT